MKKTKKSVGRNIRVSDEFHAELKKYVAPLYKISAFVENAVMEKIKEMKKQQKSNKI